jgi:formylmethanofuran dehydrogenase subunit E
MAGAKAVGAKNHFDVEVMCEGPFDRPPRSCFLDGVQAGTGATLGKRTIHTLDAKNVALKVRNSRSGIAVEVRPSRKLMEMLEPPTPPSKMKDSKQPSEEQIEETARRIAAMPDAELLSISGP